MNLVVVMALVAVIASQSEAWVQPNDVCAAYFKAIGIDRMKFPSGKLWEDKVCVSDPSFYVSCKLFNGVISGDLQQCPPGKLFNQDAKKPWDNTCVFASDCHQKNCPNWILKASWKSSTEVVNRITHGSHGCIDCVFGECHQCLCRDALKRSFNSVATVVDPNNKAGNQYLVCEGTRITCHACPKGLVWNCRLGVCAHTSECPPSPAKCQAYGCPATKTPWIPVNKQPSIVTKFPTQIFPYGMSKQQCICREALMYSSAEATYACDPYSQNKYLVCQRDRTVVARPCADGTAWNYMTAACDNMRLCRPVPAACAAL